MSSSTMAAEIATDKHNLLIYKYTILAAASFLAYDYILTFEEEYHLVWKARWSFVKALFLLTRFLAFVSVAVDIYMLFGYNTDDSCHILIRTTGELISAVFCISQIMLFLRVTVIWRDSVSILVILAVLLVAGFSIFFYFATRDALGVAAVSDSGFFGAGCLMTDHTGDFFVCHVISLINETVMVLLVIIKSWLMARHEGGLSKGYRIVVEDGIGYFVIVSLLSLVSILIARLAPQALRLFHLGAHSSLASILCCRLLLRLRVAYSAPIVQPFGTTTLGEWIVREGTLHSTDSTVETQTPSALRMQMGMGRGSSDTDLEYIELDTAAELGGKRSEWVA